MRSLVYIILLVFPAFVSAAWRFDEDITHRVSVAYNAAMDLPDSDFSMGGWIKLDDNDGASYQYFVSWGYGSSPRLLFFLAEDEAAGADQMWVRICDASGYQAECVTTGSPAESTEWQHVMVVRSGASVFTFYVNGVEDGTDTDDTVDVCNPNVPMEFGRQDDGGVGRAFGGCMAEWAKWDRALTAGERVALVQGFSPRLMPTELKWYIPMVGDYQELLVPLVVTNLGATLADHPRFLP